MNVDVATRTSTRLSNQPQIGSHTKLVSSAERRGWNQCVSPLREARGHDNAALSYVTITGEDWLEERSSSVEGIWGHQPQVSEVPIGPRRVTQKQTLRGLFLRPARSGATPKTVIRLRPGSTLNNTETELREVLKLHHHKDIAPLPPLDTHDEEDET